MTAEMSITSAPPLFSFTSVDLRIDTLVIRLSNPATPCCANPVGFDTVVLRR